MTSPAPAPATGGNAGFRMNLLPGWRAQSLQNGAMVIRSGAGLSAVLVAPADQAPAAGFGRLRAPAWARNAAQQGADDF